jgi:hypothetical protein
MSRLFLVSRALLVALLAGGCVPPTEDEAATEVPSVEVTRHELVSPDINLTPPPEWGRPSWAPHAMNFLQLRRYKRVTWTIAKNYLSDGSYARGRGSRYAKRGSNEFIVSEFKKALASWSAVADLEFPFIASGTADVTFEVVPYIKPPDSEQQQPGIAGAWKPGSASLLVSENYVDFTSLGYEYLPEGYSGPPMAPDYRGEVNPGNGWLYAITLHELGHMLGLTHVWEDNWDYAYAENDVNPRPCVGLCRFPYANANGPDFSIMDYRWGNNGGRMPRSRVLSQYDVDYARGMYNISPYVPFVETQSPNGFDYLNNWDKVGTLLDQHSFVNYPDSNGGRESLAWVSNIFGGVRRSGTASATWARLYSYLDSQTGWKTAGTDTQMPAGHNFWEDLGFVRTSSGEGYTTPLYRHVSPSGVRRITTSATPPAGYVQEVRVGYINPSPGITTDSTFRPLDDGAWYQIISRSTGKQLGAPQTSSAPAGTGIVNDPPSPTSVRNWTFYNAGENYYRLRISDNITEESALSVAGASTSDGAALQKWPYTGQSHQLWRVESVGSGYYRAIARNSGKCLQVPTAAGGQVVQRTCTGGTNQQFRIVKQGMGFEGPGIYRITARHSGKALEVSGSSTADGALVQQRTYTGAANQRWTISASGDIVAKHSGKSLQIRGGTMTNGAVAEQVTLVPSPTQTWFYQYQPGGYFRFFNNHTARCLDVASSSTADGARVQQWTCGSGNNQQFDIVRVE